MVLQQFTENKLFIGVLLLFFHAAHGMQELQNHLFQDLEKDDLFSFQETVIKLTTPKQEADSPSLARRSLDFLRGSPLARSLLLLKEPDVCASPLDCYDASGNTLLTIAAKKEVVDYMQFLLEHGASATMPDRSGLKALDYALITGNMYGSWLLLSADPKNSKTRYKGTTLPILQKVKKDEER